MNYSHKHKILWFTPLSTASRSCTPIMEYFKFDVIQNHNEKIIQGCDDYTFIMNVHNPYKRIVSIFNMIKKEKIYSSLKFESWIRKIVDDSEESNTNPNQLWLSKIYLNFNKKPDYLVKVENLYDDLMDIKIIENNFNDNLQIIFFENIIKNNYRETDCDYWKREYNEDLSKFIFEKFKTDFEIFGYDKNSWN